MNQTEKEKAEVRSKDGKTKACRRCRIERPLGDYRGYGRVRFASVCIHCPQQEAHRGRGPWIAPHPCATCNKPFLSTGIFSRVMELKFCSNFCRDTSKHTALHRCSRCGKSKTAAHYNRRKNSRSVKTICAKCEPLARSAVPPHQRPRASAHEMWRAALTKANSESRAFALTQHQVRVLYRNEPCALCGSAVAALRAKGPGPLSVANVKGYCRRCLRLLQRLTHQELVEAGAHITKYQASLSEVRHVVSA